ncbi:hypothetical protein [Lysobacter hankyongensis]
MAMIIMIVIAIVVTVVTYGAASGAVWGALGTVGTSVGATAAAGAVAAAAGSIVSQGIGSLAGVASFSWRQVGVDALAGAITAGAGVWLKSGGSAPMFAKSAAETAKKATWLTKLGSAMGGSGKLTTLGRVTQGVVGYAANVAANAAFNRDTGFSWNAMAASVVGSYASAKLGGRLTFLEGGDSSGSFFKDFSGNLIHGAVGATARRMMGLGRQDWGGIAANAFGSAVGNALGGAILKGVHDTRDYNFMREELSKRPGGYKIDPSLSWQEAYEQMGRDYNQAFTPQLGSGQLMSGADASSEVDGAPPVPAVSEHLSVGGISSDAGVDGAVVGRESMPRRMYRQSVAKAEDDVRRDKYGRPYAEGAALDQLMKIDVYARKHRDFADWSAQAVLDYVYPRYYKTENPWAIDQVLDAVAVRAEISKEDRGFYLAAHIMSRGGGQMFSKEYWDRFNREGRTITYPTRYSAGDLAWRNEPVNRLLNTIGETLVPWPYERERRNRGDWQSPPLNKWFSAGGKMGGNAFFDTINSIPVPDEDGGWMEPRTDPVFEFDNEEIDAAAALGVAAVPATILGGEFTAVRTLATANRLDNYYDLRHIRSWGDLGVPGVTYSLERGGQGLATLKYLDGVELKPYVSSELLLGQSVVYSCGAASCRMAAGLYDVPEAYVRSALGTTENGTRFANMPEGLRMLGFDGTATYIEDASADYLANASRNGSRSVVSVWQGADESHAIVLDGISDGMAYIRDPWPNGMGSSYAIPVDHLERAMTGRAVVITPKIE